MRLQPPDEQPPLLRQPVGLPLTLVPQLPQAMYQSLVYADGGWQ
jgi:hypothetical protein